MHLNAVEFEKTIATDTNSRNKYLIKNWYDVRRLVQLQLAQSTNQALGHGGLRRNSLIDLWPFE